MDFPLQRAEGPRCSDYPNAMDGFLRFNIITKNSGRDNRNDCQTGRQTVQKERPACLFFPAIPHPRPIVPSPRGPGRHFPGRKGLFHRDILIPRRLPDRRVNAGGKLPGMIPHACHRKKARSPPLSGFIGTAAGTPAAHRQTLIFLQVSRFLGPHTDRRPGFLSKHA